MRILRSPVLVSKKTRTARKRIIRVAIILMILYPVGSEIIYHRSISPNGATQFIALEGKLSQEAAVEVLNVPEGELLHFKGLLPSRGLLAVPSAAPSYYFDPNGKLVGWIQDPGDMEVPARFIPVGKVTTISYEEARARLSAGH